MPMKWTPLGAVCSQVEQSKMSLTGSRCRQLEPISNGPDAKAHEYHLIMQACPISQRARYVSAFPSITAHCEHSAHQESCPQPRPIRARFHSLAGGLPPSVSDEPYLIIPVFHLDKGSHFIPGYRDISPFSHGAARFHRRTMTLLIFVCF